ncbi:hypothetical protein [Phormidesmis priestleyi]|nr:hypothetical protein [Phormidesmis priestleyi]
MWRPDLCRVFFVGFIFSAIIATGRAIVEVLSVLSPIQNRLKC